MRVCLHSALYVKVDPVDSCRVSPQRLPAVKASRECCVFCRSETHQRGAGVDFSEPLNVASTATANRAFSPGGSPPRRQASHDVDTHEPRHLCMHAPARALTSSSFVLVQLPRLARTAVPTFSVHLCSTASVLVKHRVTGVPHIFQRPPSRPSRLLCVSVCRVRSLSIPSALHALDNAPRGRG